MIKFGLVGDWSNVIKLGKYFIKNIYILMRGKLNKVFWKFVICLNLVVFRSNFIIWIVL